MKTNSHTRIETLHRQKIDNVLKDLLTEDNVNITMYHLMIKKIRKACGLSYFFFFRKPTMEIPKCFTKVIKKTFKLLRDEFSLHTDTICDLINIAALK